VEVWKNVLSCNTKESFKKFLGAAPEADDGLNLTVSPPSRDKSLVEYDILCYFIK